MRPMTIYPGAFPAEVEGPVEFARRRAGPVCGRDCHGASFVSRHAGDVATFRSHRADWSQKTP